MQLFKTFTVALFVVFLHFSGQIGRLASCESRYHYLWSRRDAGARILDVLLLALACTLLAVGLDWLARRSGSTFHHKAIGPLFLLALVSGLLAVVPALANNHPKAVQLVWLVAAGVVGFSLGWPRSRMVHWSVNFCLILSPLVLIGFGWMLTWENWHVEPKTDFSVRKSAKPKGPVFLVVFDEWSYPRSVRHGEWRPLFENVSLLCRQSVVFSRAESPDGNSRYAIPRLVYQCDLDSAFTEEGMYWKTPDGDVSSREFPSLFTLARDAGYNTYLSGWFIPYGRVLGDQLDYCGPIRSFHVRGESLSGEMGHAALAAAANMTDPLSRRFWRGLSNEVNARRRWRIADDLFGEMERIISNCPSNSFVMLHVPLPHQPFVFNEDGSYRGLVGRDWEDSPAGYMRNLKCVDLYVGRLIDTLKARGTFDDATLVLTSNHGWREEPEPDYRQGPDWCRHVPLVIKLPGQTSARRVDTPLETNRLSPLLEDIFHGQCDADKLIGLITPNLPTE